MSYLSRVKNYLPLVLIAYGLVNTILPFASYGYGVMQLGGLPNNQVQAYLLLYNSITSFAFEFGAIVFFVGIVLYINQRFKELKVK